MRCSVTKDSPSGSGRALIPLGPRLEWQAAGPFHNSRPLTVFIAQLIATAQSAPQTRARRRAGADHAAALYTAAAYRVRPSAVECSI